MNINLSYFDPMQALQSLTYPFTAAAPAVAQEKSSTQETTDALFQNVLSGNNAFYNKPDYMEATRRDFAQVKPLPATYSWDTEHKIIKIIKRLFSLLMFHIGLYTLIQALVGKIAILPASNPKGRGLPGDYAHQIRSNIALDGEWKYKRITVVVDGCKIDAAIVGKASTLGNGRWVLASNGNSGCYEEKLFKNKELKQILTEVKGNAIVFNYPGVGASAGMPNRQSMVKAYKAMLHFLEDQQKGIGAKEIIGYGHSIGGGVQGEALQTHALKKEIKYVFVKGRTFSNLSSVVSRIKNIALGFLVKMLGWNFDSVASSKRLKAPEIILQSARVPSYELLTDSTKIIDDGVIPADASLAKALLDDGSCPKNNKVFIGIPEDHNADLSNPAFLAKTIDSLLAKQNVA